MFRWLLDKFKKSATDDAHTEGLVTPIDRDSKSMTDSYKSGYHDWNPGSYSQSYDDFHDEQDDYDMMDDDF